MIPQYRGYAAGVLVLLALAAAGCETTTPGTTAYSTPYVDDSRIASDVRSRLVGDSATNYSRVGVTTTNGVVYLTGTVDSSDRAARAARLASEVYGVQRVVNSLQVASVSPPSTIVVTPAPSTVVTTPPPVVMTPPPSVAPEQPPIDASGVVAQYDPQTGIVVFQDGRMMRITGSSGVWSRVGTGVLQPGAQVSVRNAVPVGYRPTAAQSGVTSWRMGTVNRVDPTSNLIYLNDGSVVHVAPSGVLLNGGRQVPLADILPGSQVAIGISAQPSVVVTPSTSLGSTPSTSYPSALPREMVAPIESPQVHVIVLP